MIPRLLAATLAERLGSFAAVVLVGARQVGKTTLARDLVDALDPDAVYLDLERPADRRRLADADAFLRAQAPRLVVLDEVHRVPELFEVLRGVIDDNRRSGFRAGQFLLLGSASLELVRFTSESLAGRLSHLEMGGIGVDEAAAVGISEDTLWLRGGFPDSLTAPTDAISLQWRADLIHTYLERDAPMFAPLTSSESLRRLWTMLAHNSGGLLNASRLAAGLGVSGPTVDRYIDLLTDLRLLRRLSSWHANTGKRVTKAPKVFVRDSGLLHALLEVETLHDLLGHPSAGPSYESFVVESLVNAASTWSPYHYRTARGDEIDLVLVRSGKPQVAIEIKRSTSPTLAAGFHRSAADLAVPHRFLVHPEVGDDPYADSSGAVVIGLQRLVERLREGPEGLAG